MSSTPSVIEFLSGASSHPRGFFVDDVMVMSHKDFENSHDIIQWMFPLPQASRAQPHSPVLSSADVRTLRETYPAVQGIRNSREYYKRFLVARPHIWCVPFNHNHLRITRAVQAMSLLVETSFAKDFLKDVTRVNAENGNKINPTSVRFWQEALRYGPSYDKDAK